MVVELPNLVLKEESGLLFAVIEVIRRPVHMLEPLMMIILEDEMQEAREGCEIWSSGCYLFVMSWVMC